MAGKYIRRHTGRGSYDLFSNYAHYVPGYGGMMMLFLMFLLGALLGNIVTGGLTLVSPEFVTMYGMVISYPLMFVPVLLYASANSRRNEFFETGYAVDSRHFGQLGGFRMALIVSVATMATAFVADSLNLLLPAVPEWFEQIMDQMMTGPVWITLISVSVFAPLFEEWLCRGLVLRGLLQKTHPASAIMVSAAFFAILHMNPWQALPAFLLGILFGYVYYRTGSLKLTMLMHCVNNTFSVLVSKVPAFEEAETFMDILSPWAYAGIYIACVLMLASALILITGITVKDRKMGGCDEVAPMSID